MPNRSERPGHGSPQSQNRQARSVPRQQRPKERSRHALHEAPDEIAYSVLIGEIGALEADRSGADMLHYGTRYLDAAVAHEAQSKGQIDILDVAEKSLVKAVYCAKYVGANEAGGSARSEYLTLRW